MTVYVLTDGPSASLHRRLLQAEMKMDAAGIKVSECQFHQGYRDEILAALAAAAVHLPISSDALRQAQWAKQQQLPAGEGSKDS